MGVSLPPTTSPAAVIFSRKYFVFHSSLSRRSVVLETRSMTLIEPATIDGARRVAEQVGPRLLAAQLDQLGAARNAAAGRATEALAEGGGDQVDLVHHAEVLVGAAAGLADEARGVRLVHQDHGVVLLGQGAGLVQGHQVAVHGEHAVTHDQPGALVLVQLQLLAQVLHVHVLEGVVVRRAQTDAVDQRGVDQPVGDDHVLGAQDGLEHAGVGVHARGEQQRLLHAQELRHLVLQLAVDVLGAADEAHRAHAVAALVQTLVGRLDHVGVAAQAQVVVGAEVQHVLVLGALGVLDLDLGVLGRADEALLLVEALVLDLLDLGGEHIAGLF